jgi:hypothetical protein
MVVQPQLAIRSTRGNRNHHLWNNNGTWSIHYTVHLPDFTKLRVRTTLGTHDVKDARRKRDAILAGQVVAA